MTMSEYGKWKRILTAPLSRDYILAYDPQYGIYIAKCETYGEKTRWLLINNSERYPTHWMPLPEPPEVKNDY